MLSYFSREEACAILEITPGRLLYWNRIGLVKPSIRKKGRNYYDFQDLLCLRTAQGLISRGLAATEIKKSIESLKGKFPGFDDYLADKRIYVFGNRAVISHKNRLIDPRSGQLLFRFDVEDLAQKVQNSVTRFESKKTAQDWFREGLEYDADETTHKRALHAYRQALELDPAMVDAHVNMGNIYYHQKRFRDAERCYRLALAPNPSHSKACFNLGNVLDELNRTEEAIHYYEKSLKIDPHFPDAHYNLAVACEKMKLWQRALQHWKNYLDFDSESRHADLARKRVRVIESHLVIG